MSRVPRAYLLDSGDMRVSLLDLGCTLQSWQVAGREMVLGHADPAAYLSNPHSMGVIVGRMAGRIGGAGFDWQGERIVLDANDGPNTLHGGAQGLSRLFWEAEPDGHRALRLTHVSPHGAGGWPGRVTFRIIVSLSETALRYDMMAEADRPTPVSLAQHAYYTLGAERVDALRLRMQAGQYLDCDAGLVATGDVREVPGALDFRAGRALPGARQGIDLPFVLDAPEIALDGPDGPGLRLETDQPCAQVYVPSRPGGIAPFSAVCIEPQGYPNAMNLPAFPVSVAAPGAPYRQKLVLGLERRG